MKAISLREPWAWLCLHGNKDFENRPRWTSFSGNVLVHSSAKPDRYIDLIRADVRRMHGIHIPEKLNYGGITGLMNLGCYTKVSESEWFQGIGGYPINKTQVLPFQPWNGMLGFWDFPDEVFMKLLNQVLEEGHPNPEGFLEQWSNCGDFSRSL